MVLVAVSAEDQRNVSMACLPLRRLIQIFTHGQCTYPSFKEEASRLDSRGDLWPGPQHSRACGGRRRRPPGVAMRV